MWRVAKGTCASGSTAATWLLPIVYHLALQLDYFSAQNMRTEYAESVQSDRLSSKFSETNEVALATHAFLCTRLVYKTQIRRMVATSARIGKYNSEFGKKVATLRNRGKYAASEGMVVCDLTFTGS